MQFNDSFYYIKNRTISECRNRSILVIDKSSGLCSLTFDCNEEVYEKKTKTQYSGFRRGSGSVILNHDTYETMILISRNENAEKKFHS